MTIWLFGDSIFRGAALGRFPDEYSSEEIAADPLWPVSSPAAVMNLALGEDLVKLGGVTGLPDGVEKAVRRLAAFLNSGSVQRGDTVVFLDVGHHARDPDRHQAQWLALRSAAVAEYPIELIMCGGFDDGAQGDHACQHDIAFEGRSHNDAVRAAATAAMITVGHTRFLELSPPLQAFNRWTLERFGLSAYRRDGIHLNLWGQMRLCGLILDVAAPGRRRDAKAMQSVVDGIWQAAGAPSGAAAWEMTRRGLLTSEASVEAV